MTLFESASLVTTVAFAVSLAACGGGAADAPPSAAAPQAGAAAPPPAAAPMALPPVATVNGVAVSNKGDHFTRVTITFKNPGNVPCKVTSYTMTWAGGKKTIGLEGANFTVAPGAAEIRAIRVHPSDGDLTVLINAEGAKVDLESDCH
jgi:hypothetical protein